MSSEPQGEGWVGEGNRVNEEARRCTPAWRASSPGNSRANAVRANGPHSAVAVCTPAARRLVVYSDGATEAAAPGGELFGTERLASVAMKPWRSRSTSLSTRSFPTSKSTSSASGLAAGQPPSIVGP